VSPTPKWAQLEFSAVSLTGRSRYRDEPPAPRFEALAPTIFTRNDSSEIDRLTDGIDAVVSFSAVLDRPRTRFSPFA